MGKVIVVVPEGYQPEPLDCPVCQLAFRHLPDVMNFRKWGCCEQCDLIYRWPNKEKWNKGWRPEIKTPQEDN